jgi:uncharacterized low-complexity protein
MKKTINVSKKLLGSTLALGVATTLGASAITTPKINVSQDAILSISEVASHAVVLGHGGDHKCGEGKCGEGKCGEGKCGEGKDKKKH